MRHPCCKNCIFIVKNMFDFSILYLQLFNVIDKSYTQVLTPVNNSQLLLKLVILNKFRLVTFHSLATQRNLYIKLVHTSLGEMRVIITLIYNVPFWRQAMLSARHFWRRLSFGVSASCVNQLCYHIYLFVNTHPPSKTSSFSFNKNVKSKLQKCSQLVPRCFCEQHFTKWHFRFHWH
jgi:hypothetical protein